MPITCKREGDEVVVRIPIDSPRVLVAAECVLGSFTMGWLIEAGAVHPIPQATEKLLAVLPVPPVKDESGCPQCGGPTVTINWLWGPAKELCRSCRRPEGATRAQPAARSSHVLLAFGPAVRKAITEGDGAALMKGLASTASMWLEMSGHHRSYWAGLTAVHCFELGGEPKPLLAAALALLDVLALSPQGRQALLDLGFEPVREQPEGPGA